MSFFERYLTVWVVLCIAAGIALGKFAPEVARALDGMAITVNDAPVVSVPIAICLFLMMYPIMVKIDFHEVVKAGKALRPVGLTLFINWAIKPFTMYAIASFFLGTLFLKFIGPDATDLVKMPFGKELSVGDVYGAGQVLLVDGVKMLEVPLWRSYLAGCILLGIAPCTAMVLVWGYLSKGNDGHTLLMVAINSLTMLLLFGILGGFLLGVGQLPVPWEALLLSIGVYVALPLVAGYAVTQVDHCEQGRRVVPRPLPALPDARHDHRIANDADFAVLVQGRDHRAESADDPVDCRAAIRANGVGVRIGLRTVEISRPELRERGTHGDDRCLESFRGRDRNRSDAVRAVFGGGACHRRGCPDRSAFDADAGQVLPRDAGLVSSCNCIIQCGRAVSSFSTLAAFLGIAPSTVGRWPPACQGFRPSVSQLRRDVDKRATVSLTQALIDSVKNVGLHHRVQIARTYTVVVIVTGSARRTQRIIVFQPSPAAGPSSARPAN